MPAPVASQWTVHCEACSSCVWLYCSETHHLLQIQTAAPACFYIFPPARPQWNWTFQRINLAVSLVLLGLRTRRSRWKVLPEPVMLTVWLSEFSVGQHCPLDEGGYVRRREKKQAAASGHAPLCWEGFCCSLTISRDRTNSAASPKAFTSLTALSAPPWETHYQRLPGFCRLWKVSLSVLFFFFRKLEGNVLYCCLFKCIYIHIREV